MSALDKNPAQLNMLNPQGFKFQIKKLPNCNFFLQHVTIPEIDITPVKQANPFATIYYSGDDMVFGNVDIDFKVDSDLTNYKEIYAWMRGLGFPEELSEYGDLARKPKLSGEGLFSDASVIVTTGLKNPNVEFVFKDCFPIALGKLTFNTTEDTIQYLTCIATFRYTLFEISKL